MAADDALPDEEIAAWFRRHVPARWFEGHPRVLVDRDEVLVVGTLAHPSAAAGDEGAPDDDDADDGAAEGDADGGSDATDGERDLLEQEHIGAFREATRDQRIAIAARAEALYGRKVSWAAECGRTRVTFTHLSVPVMTRLRIGERRLLDTLVAAGVARSRSDALGWCVRLVAEHEGEWLAELRDALEAVERIKARRSA